MRVIVLAMQSYTDLMLRGHQRSRQRSPFGLLQRPEAAAISAFAILPVPVSADARRSGRGMACRRQIDLLWEEFHLNI
jgi:hypothetical protein